MFHIIPNVKVYFCFKLIFLVKADLDFALVWAGLRKIKRKQK